MNKKAWIRIVEASIASLIVIGVVLIILSRQQTKTKDIYNEIHEKQRYILEIISKNETLRKNVIMNEKTPIDIEISKMVPSTWDFSTNICRINEICSGEIPYDRDVYATETIITSILTEYSPKKLKFFVWMR
jgi:hypothetical protein